MLIAEEELSNKDKERLIIIVEAFINDEFNSSDVADVLDASKQTARRLLRVAEENGVIYSKGKTSDRRYSFCEYCD